MKVLVLVVGLGVGSLSLAADHTVKMKSLSYDPKVVNIKVGDSVEWVNESYTEHSASADDKKTFDTGMVEPKKKSKKIKFTHGGSFTFHCSVHGPTMNGTIVVEQ